MRRLLIAFLVLALAGCAPRPDAAQKEIESRGREFRDLSKSRIVSVLDEPYLAARRISSTQGGVRVSGVLAKDITFIERGNLTRLCTLLSTLTGLPVTIDTAGAKDLSGLGSDDLDPLLRDALNGSAPATSRGPNDVTAKISYTGNVKGLLDVLSARFGLAWEYSPGTGVTFAATAVRTFVIKAAIGAVSFKNSITNSSGDSGSSVSNSNQEMSGETSQSNETNFRYDPWKDIEGGVKGLLSPNGSVTSDQREGTITVKDTAPSLARIEQFIDQKNENLSRAVALSVRVYSLEVSENTDIGLALSMFFESPDVRVFSGTASPLPEFGGQGGELSAAVVNGKLKDSTSLMKALRSVGKATQKTSAGGVVSNNRPFPVQSVKSDAYLAKSSFSTSDSGTETTSLEPGEVTTGFSMTVVPHIFEGRRLNLQYYINLSSLDDIQEFRSGQTSIQLPKRSRQTLGSEMPMKMGQTLVLAGFEKEVDSRGASGGFLGFGKSKSYSRSLLVITISTEAGEA